MKLKFHHGKFLEFYLFSTSALLFLLLLPLFQSSNGISLQKRRVSSSRLISRNLTDASLRKISKCKYEKCLRKKKTKRVDESSAITMVPTSFFQSPDNDYITPTTTITSFPIDSIESTLNPTTIPISDNLEVDFTELRTILRSKRKNCKRKSNSTNTNFSCEKVKLASWLLNESGKNETNVIDTYVRLLKNPDAHFDLTTPSELLPENLVERIVYKFILKHGEPVDKLLFYQFKKYVKSRELLISIPNYKIEVGLSPRTRTDVGTGRTLFDPGFNLKLKLPFFHDELKVAVSTGPSFLAGLGVGLIILGIKSIFAPFIFAIKAMIFSWVFKDMGPLDIFKTIASPILPTWLIGGKGQGGGGGGGWIPHHVIHEESHYPGWEHSIESYEPPHVHNVWDSITPSGPGKKSARDPSNINIFPFSSPDQLHQYTQPNPTFQTSQKQNNPMKPPRRPPNSFRQNPFSDDVRAQTILKPPGPFQNGGPSSFSGPDNGDHPESEPEDSHIEHPNLDSGFDPDNYDPFYSPLLSRIDSIFMHLGFTDEGCKERSVCSIYKFPVKYAPYSNLLSAQLSKHQSELKRPITTSPKVLRYFKYMKAAKDGQASLNCIELYPKCKNDTEKLSNLPMVKTFQQLTELMGTTGPSGPA